VLGGFEAALISGPDRASRVVGRSIRNSVISSRQPGRYLVLAGTARRPELTEPVPFRNYGDLPGSGTVNLGVNVH
jgi:hypothetical protein